MQLQILRRDFAPHRHSMLYDTVPHHDTNNNMYPTQICPMTTTQCAVIPFSAELFAAVLLPLELRTARPGRYRTAIALSGAPPPCVSVAHPHVHPLPLLRCRTAVAAVTARWPACTRAVSLPRCFQIPEMRPPYLSPCCTRSLSAGVWSMRAYMHSNGRRVSRR